jgi:hypothetical protein
MNDSKNTLGAIEWRDLTVSDADGVSDFYVGSRLAKAGCVYG